MNDVDVIDQLKSAVGPVPEPPAYRMEAVRARARSARQRRWTSAIGSAAMAVAIVGGLVAVNGRPAGLTPVNEVNLIAAAADKAVDARTVRMEISAGATGMPQASMRGTGEMDFVRQTGRMTVPGLGEMVFVGDMVYVPIPEAIRSQFGAKLGGKKWISQKDDAGSASPLDSFTRPQDMLDMLRKAAGDPERLGRETIRGVSATGYRFDVGDAVRDLLPEAGKAAMTVHIDDDGLPRRLVTDVTTSLPRATAPIVFRLSVDFFDYGAAIEPVTAPPASEVADESLASLLGGALTGG